ncbi:DUF397 domain-containing protein [Streptomyces sp. NPDC046909]|uniref:DUF397 domain-containing protein n=1 Tax=Streptomyces sp. NPDC046909 TaxID=3155617 RepID=UPI0033FFDCB6
MDTPDAWRKSSYSGPGDGDSCVEIADRRTQVAIRDSKYPTYGSLSFPPAAFATFISTLKTETAAKPSPRPQPRT